MSYVPLRSIVFVLKYVRSEGIMKFQSILILRLVAGMAFAKIYLSKKKKIFWLMRLTTVFVRRKGFGVQLLAVV